MQVTGDIQASSVLPREKKMNAPQADLGVEVQRKIPSPRENTGLLYF